MPLYALTIFLGAFLLFQVQPLMGKFILPWFGGGPGVWTTCMLFFQVLLLGGYAYAHFTSRWLKPRTQALVHLLVLLVALASLPITPSEHWKPQPSANPTFQIMALLSVCLGAPYFVLSTTGPLLQQWFGRAHPGRSPYRLYALSNCGSLLALLSYPFFFETHFTRRTQAALWAGGLALYALSCAWCALKQFKVQSSKFNEGTTRPQDHETTGPGTGGFVSRFTFHVLPFTHHASRVTPSTRSPAHSLTALLWLLLPACASVLLLATTNKLCQDVAVVPFLWVLPLALYLLSFIICFDSPRWYIRAPFALGLVAALGGAAWALADGSDWPLWKQVAVYTGALFICCMVCHGELYRLRPEPSRLTGFYLMLAAGGALGGLFAAVAAPLLFSDYYELHWGLVLCGLLFLVVVCVQSPKSEAQSPKSDHKTTRPQDHQTTGPQTAGLVSRITQHARRNAHYVSRIGWGLLALGWVYLAVTLWRQVRDSHSEVVSRTRNFYGVLTVYEHRKDEPDGHHFLLQHGRITHGLQFVDKEMAAWPTSYYSRDSGIGLGMNALPSGPRRIGVVGLGTGSLTVYGRPADYFRIYEINPQVKQLASSRFTYLSNCPARTEVVLGDARLAMEREAPQHFDLLALDAFSSDAIPVHLLTEEAFTLYERHMKSKGIIAVHISNHYLDLEPVVLNLSRRFHYQVAAVDFDENDEEWWLYGSTWLLLTRDEQIVHCEAIRSAAYTIKTNHVKVPLWTDDFAGLFQILKQ